MRSLLKRCLLKSIPVIEILLNFLASVDVIIPDPQPTSKMLPVLEFIRGVRYFFIKVLGSTLLFSRELSLVLLLPEHLPSVSEERQMQLR